MLNLTTTAMRVRRLHGHLPQLQTCEDPRQLCHRQHHLQQPRLTQGHSRWRPACCPTTTPCAGVSQLYPALRAVGCMQACPWAPGSLSGDVQPDAQPWMTHCVCTRPAWRLTEAVPHDSPALEPCCLTRGACVQGVQGTRGSRSGAGKARLCALGALPGGARQADGRHPAQVLRSVWHRNCSGTAHSRWWPCCTSVAAVCVWGCVPACDLAAAAVVASPRGMLCRTSTPVAHCDVMQGAQAATARVQNPVP